MASPGFSMPGEARCRNSTGQRMAATLAPALAPPASRLFRRGKHGQNAVMHPVPIRP